MALIKVCVVYEDGNRTKKLLKYIRQVIEELNWESLIRIDECDLDEYDNCIVAIPCFEMKCADSPDVILSRFSGSAFYRGNAGLQDIMMLLCKAHTDCTTVLNGTPIIQLEDSKPLQMATLTNGSFLSKLTEQTRGVVRLPSTVLMKQLTPRSMQCAWAAIKEGKCMPQNDGALDKQTGVVIKPAFGGGSKDVIVVHVDANQQLPSGDHLKQLVKEKTTDTCSRPWLMQQFVGDVEVQIRVEAIDAKVCYAVVIRKTTQDAPEAGQLWKDADNLCMCEVSDEVSLTLCSTPTKLADTLHKDGNIDQDKSKNLAQSVFHYTEAAAKHVHAAVLAMEFRVDRSGCAYMIDLNLNSNYNFDSEETLQDLNPQFVLSAERYLEMFISNALKNKSPQQCKMIESELNIDIPGVPEHINAFEQTAGVYLNGKEVSLEKLLATIVNKDWKMTRRAFKHSDARYVLTYTNENAVMYIHRSIVTLLITLIHVDDSEVDAAR